MIRCGEFIHVAMYVKACFLSANQSKASPVTTRQHLHSPVTTVSQSQTEPAEFIEAVISVFAPTLALVFAPLAEF